MAWEWILLAFTWLGIRKRTSLRELIGGRWTNLEEFLRDVLYAATFWVCALAVLGLGAKLMHLDQAGKIDSMRKQLGFLTPGSHLELAVWFCLSATAGFCEEIIFRGYLQRQLAAFSKSTLIGVLLSAAIFGASHGYEGVARMLLIGIYGLLFGLLAWWRKSLRPGMMAHAWHDAIQRCDFANAEIASVHAPFTHAAKLAMQSSESSAERCSRVRESKIAFARRRRPHIAARFLLDYFFQ